MTQQLEPEINTDAKGAKSRKPTITNDTSRLILQEIDQWLELFIQLLLKFLLFLRVKLFVTEFQTSLSYILEGELPMIKSVSRETKLKEANLLPATNVLHKDLIEGFAEQKDFVATGMEFLNEHALGEVLRSLSHIGKIEYLFLAFLPMCDVLFGNTSIAKTWQSLTAVLTSFNVVSFLWFVGNFTSDANFSLFL